MFFQTTIKGRSNQTRLRRLNRQPEAINYFHNSYRKSDSHVELGFAITGFVIAVIILFGGKE